MSSHDTWMKRLDPLGELNLNAADDTEKGNWMRRLLLVEKAWRTLDVNGDGSVDMHELVQAYDAGHVNAEVDGRRLSPAAAKEYFASQWDADGSGSVEKHEFVEYYAKISAEVEVDDVFEEMIRAAWHIPRESKSKWKSSANKGQEVDTWWLEPGPRSGPEEKADHMQELIHKRLEVITNYASVYRQTETLKAYFKKYDANGSGFLEFREFDAALVDLLEPGRPDHNKIDEGFTVGRRALFDRYDHDTSDSLSFEELVNAVFGLTPNASADRESRRMFERLRAHVAKANGVHGIRNLGLNLRILDERNTGALPVKEVLYALEDAGSRMTPDEKNLVAKYFDLEQSGFVDVRALMRGIRGKMTAKRMDLVNQAWSTRIATNGEREVPVSVVQQKIDPTMNPDVFSGKKTFQQVVNEVPDHWDRNSDEMVSHGEFMEYYRDISAGLPDDEHFEMVIRNSWHLFDAYVPPVTGYDVIVTFKQGGSQRVHVDNDANGKFGVAPHPEDFPALRKRLFMMGIRNVADVKLA